MEEVMNDIGYQQSLENMIYHKMLIQDLIFKNPIFMTMVFCEIFKGYLSSIGEAEVEFEGSTSTLHVKGHFSFDDVNIAMCGTLAMTIYAHANNDGKFMDLLVERLMATSGQDFCTCMGIIMRYVKDPTKMHGFYKVLNIAQDEFQILLS